MTGRTRKWLVLLICACLLASGLSAFADTLTLKLDAEKARGAEFEIFKIGEPDGSSDSAWSPTKEFAGVKFPKETVVENGIRTWSGTEKERIMGEADSVINAKNLKPINTLPVKNGQVTFEGLDSGVYYCRLAKSEGYYELKLKNFLITLPMLSSADPHNVVADLTQEGKVEYVAPEPTSIAVHKEWEDESNRDGIQSSSVEVYLLRDNMQVDTATLSLENNWTHRWTDLESKNPATGLDYTYTVEENEQSVDQRYVPVVSGGPASFTVTNTYTPPKGALMVTKQVKVNDEDTDWYTRTFHFTIEGPTDADFEAQKIEKTDLNYIRQAFEIRVSKGAIGSVIFEGLTPGTYRVTELNSDELTAEGMVTFVDNGVEPTSYADVVVRRDTTAESNPALVSFVNDQQTLGSLKITKRVTINDAGTTSKDLDHTYLFNVTGPYGYATQVSVKIENGKANSVSIPNLVPGEYKVEEVKTGMPEGVEYVSGDDSKSLTIDRNGNIREVEFTFRNNKRVATPTPAPTPTPRTGGGGGGGGTRVVTNPTPTPFVTPRGEETPEPEDTPEVETSETPEVEETPTPEITSTPTPAPTPTPVTNVDVRKVWVDDSNDHHTRPATITVQLLRDDTVIDTATFSGNANGWFYRFSRLPAVDEAGVPYRYSILELAVDGYDTTVDGNTITNTLIDQPPSRIITLTGRKIWEDDDNVSGRPAQITVVLLRNGKSYEQRTVTAANGWQFSFQNLPYDDGFGNVYTYEFREAPVAGYFTRMDGDDTIVNYRLPGPVEYAYFDGTGTPLAGFENETEEDLEELIELFGYDSPLWGEQLLPTGDELPPYVIAFGGVGAAALIALILLTVLNKRKQRAA